MAVLTALVAVTVAAAAPTTTTAATTGDWQSFTPGSVWTDAQCTDLANPTEPTAASCQALCDNTPSCTAINAMTGKAGGCALRACPCGQHLLPAGENKPFTPYMRMSCNDAPPPPLHLPRSHVCSVLRWCCNVLHYKLGCSGTQLQTAR